MQIQRVLIITTVIILEDFALKKNLALQRISTLNSMIGNKKLALFLFTPRNIHGGYLLELPQ